MLINVVLCQLRVGGGITLAEKIHIFKRKPDFVCLPEYFMIPPDARDYPEFIAQFDKNLRTLSRWSNELDTTLIGGTVAEKVDAAVYNTCFVFRKGQKLVSYRKQFPTVHERERGIMPGKKYIIFEIDGLRIGIMVCADVLHEEAFRKFGKLKADIIFVPTVSPLRPYDTYEARRQRDQEIFVKGALLSKAFVVKTCGIGSIFGHVQNGRSLVAAPWGILWQVTPENEQHPRIQNMILDIDELREFRRASMINEVVGQIKSS